MRDSVSAPITITLRASPDSTIPVACASPYTKPLHTALMSSAAADVAPS